MPLKEMKCRKTVGPPGIVAKTLKASGSVGLEVLAHLIKLVIAKGVVPADWRDSIIVNLYKVKRMLRIKEIIKALSSQMKLVEPVIERRIRKLMDIDEMQFGFVFDRSAANAVFIVLQLQEKYLTDTFLFSLIKIRHLIKIPAVI